MESLSAVRRSGQKLEIALRLQQKQAEADDVQKKNKLLSDQIDLLIGKLMDEWVKGQDNARRRSDLGRQSRTCLTTPRARTTLAESSAAEMCLLRPSRRL